MGAASGSRREHIIKVVCKGKRYWIYDKPRTKGHDAKKKDKRR